jgi:hypothetical protein
MIYKTGTLTKLHSPHTSLSTLQLLLARYFSSPFPRSPIVSEFITESSIDPALSLPLLLLLLARHSSSCWIHWPFLFVVSHTFLFPNFFTKSVTIRFLFPGSSSRDRPPVIEPVGDDLSSLPPPFSHRIRLVTIFLVRECPYHRSDG